MGKNLSRNIGTACLNKSQRFKYRNCKTEILCPLNLKTMLFKRFYDILLLLVKKSTNFMA